MASIQLGLPTCGLTQPGLDWLAPRGFMAITCTIWLLFQYEGRVLHGFSARIFLVLGPKDKHWGPGTKSVQKPDFGCNLGSFWALGSQFQKKNVDKATLLTWGHGLGHGQGHGSQIWDPKFGSQIWGPNLGSQIWVPGPKMVPNPAPGLKIGPRAQKKGPRDLKKGPRA